MTTQIYELWVAIIVLAVAGLFLAVVLALPDLRRLATALRSRGEVADGPDYFDVDIVPGMRRARSTLSGALADCDCEDCDELMDVANSTPMYGEDWQLWAEQCHSLAPLAQRVARIRKEYQ